MEVEFKISCNRRSWFQVAGPGPWRTLAYDVQHQHILHHHPVGQLVCPAGSARAPTGRDGKRSLKPLAWSKQEYADPATGLRRASTLGSSKTGRRSAAKCLDGRIGLRRGGTMACTWDSGGSRDSTLSKTRPSEFLHPCHRDGVVGRRVSSTRAGQDHDRLRASLHPELFGDALPFRLAKREVHYRRSGGPVVLQWSLVHLHIKNWCCKDASTICDTGYAKRDSEARFDVAQDGFYPHPSVLPRKPVRCIASHVGPARGDEGGLDLHGHLEVCTHTERSTAKRDSKVRICSLVDSEAVAESSSLYPYPYSYW
ncbi:hypothetical protein C8Q74DRAFT_1215812 [Fomes fomentarius]|nr:hypothetical protein C8Q74DRAFT_1215812 [Fomes fomentarius]